ncbi:MAG: tetratricopeptide repeat protein [Candidatus Methanoplasma sp.]|jgi:tetratricopeptide (TPR) repeat protein|nr:tetratricopeptide repeat protein [Candidatus Methanoplasma sp.]
MVHEPVFQDSFEANIWKKIMAGSGSASEKSDLYVGIAETVIRRNKPINSQLLSLLIEKLFVTQSDGTQALIDRLVSKRRPNDCMPALVASFFYADLGEWDRAREMTESAEHAGNIPMLGCAKARIAMGTGDTRNAKKELMKARCSDPLFPMFYELIRQIEPDEGWTYRQNIELLVSGKEQIPLGDDIGSNSVKRLYGIYDNWYGGRRDKATEVMINSEEYADRDPEYILASARMSVNENDWKSAQMMYSLLLAKNADCVYIICEAAKAYYSGGIFDRALFLYRDAEALDPLSPAVMRGLIKTYSAMGMNAEASQCAKEYMDGEDADLEAYVSGTKTLLSNSLYRDAEYAVARILLSYPDDPNAFILKSEIEFGSGNTNAALKTMAKGIGKNPKNADMRLRRAEILFNTGRVGRAAADLKKAERIDPRNIGVLVLMKDIAVSGNKGREAAALSSRILELDPGNASAMDTLSETNLSRRHPEVSYASYKDMMVADNRAENFVNVLSSMVAEGMYGEAIRMFAEKEREFGRNPAAICLKGNAEYAIGNYGAASASFASASEIDSKNPVIWHSKGMADEARGDIGHAEEAYNRAILLDMNEPEYWISRSSIQEKRGDLPGAAESLNKAIGLRPGDIYALVRKGMIFAELGRFGEASYFLDMAMATEPDNVDAVRIQRDVKMAAGNTADAEKLALKIVEMLPSDEEGTAAAVRILMIGGKIDTAAALIENALKQKPSSVPLLMVKKDFLLSRGDSRSAIDTCKLILTIQPDNGLVRNDLAEAYAAVGNVNAANRLYSDMRQDAASDLNDADSTKKAKVPDTIKRYAERTLRRAYISKLTLNDPDLMDAMNFDTATAGTVMAYLSDISEYGDITPGTSEFERMEKLSFNAVVRGRCTGLEKDPIISIPCAYVAGGAKDADEAKRLVAYIHKALSSGKSPILPNDLRKIAEAAPKGVNLEEIMKTSKIGVYRAKAVKDAL